MGRVKSTAVGHRRLWVVLASLVAVGLIVWIVFAVVTSRSGAVGPQPSPGSTDAVATASPSPNATTSATPEPSDSAEPPASGPLPPERPAVPLDGDAADDSGVTVSLAEIESVSGEASAPGEISGPAIRVTVKIENASDEALPLRYAAVNAYHGAERTPAPPIMQPGGEPFFGTIDAGDSATAVYLFSIPSDAQKNVTIAVDYQPGESTVIFTGAVR